MTPLFALDHVGLQFGDQRVLDDVCFDVTDGGITVLLGPSGSGKTTILRLLNRLEVPTTGEVRFRGTPIADIDPLELRRRVGMVFQRPTVFPGTGRDNLRVADPDADDAELSELLDTAGLRPSYLDRVADDLSGGEAQRLCLARTLATRPEVLLMDEPTSSLDPEARQHLEITAKHLAADGIPMVWVTHDLAQADRLAHQRVVIVDGRVAEAERAAEYLANGDEGDEGDEDE